MITSCHPYVFAAGPFEAALLAGDDVIKSLVDHTVDEPAFDWSLDGTEETEIICPRVFDDGTTGSLVDVVQRSLEPRDEAAVLLAFVSRDEGRLRARSPFVGYLLPREIRRVVSLLRATSFGDVAAERDRRLLLRIFTEVLVSEHGVYWRAS